MYKYINVYNNIIVYYDSMRVIYTKTTHERYYTLYGCGLDAGQKNGFICPELKNNVF